MPHIGLLDRKDTSSGYENKDEPSSSRWADSQTYDFLNHISESAAHDPVSTFVAVLVAANGRPSRDPLLAEFDEVMDAIIFWKAVVARTIEPLPLAYAQQQLIRLQDKADRLAEEIEEC